MWSMWALRRLDPFGDYVKSNWPQSDGPNWPHLDASSASAGAVGVKVNADGRTAANACSGWAPKSSRRSGQWWWASI